LITGIDNPGEDNQPTQGDLGMDPIGRYMMLLASIGAGKELHAIGRQFLIPGVRNILDPFIDEVQIHLGVALKSRA
jgi:hypothetical protein